MKGKKIILCIICLVAILSIIIAFGVSQKDNAKDKTNEENQNNMQIELQERQCQRMLKLPHNCTHLTC